MKLAVIGSRTFTDWERMFDVLNDIDIDEIISGGAQGADHLAEWYANRSDTPITVIRPDYEKFHYRIAPKIRNKEIVNLADEVIAFWDGFSSGTADAIDYARKIGKPVRICLF